ncbi:hypothetical protein QQ008_19100 [Fulvivirgaceae bacterium BMA10]|uniref:DUF4177 domain-containing protein n=1 Tax=Splendidivirga corallicola TaxID=3051826 RepID=A0ABT8KSX4_9BACT|nr:hypothetical protein [Fulvivirgaceae bacterium BMA10]
MKQIFLTTAVIIITMISAAAQEYKVITSVESIVPAGIGRSRLIENKENVNAENFKTERTDGRKSDMKEVKRKNLKINKLSETKLLNFYSIAGINFQNIASNDALITSRLNELTKDGWELVFVTSAVESDGGETDGEGIFITRYIFKR